MDAAEAKQELSATDAALTYHEKEPDVVVLKQAYENTISELGTYFQQCQDARDQRLNYWPGKSHDLRKKGADAFPWPDASDTEAHVISQRIDNLVALNMSALAKANIRAYPVEIGDTSRAKVVSSFLKWMINSYIQGFKEHAENVANYGFERGLMVSYVGWEKRDTSYLQSLNLEQIRASAPDLAALIVDGQSDDEIAALLRGVFKGLSNAKAKKAISQLRKTGMAELPVSRRSVDRPCVEACAPDSDVFFPPYCIDPQKAPYVFWRTFLTPQQLEGKVITDGWDQDWVDYAIKALKGVDTAMIDSPSADRSVTTSTGTQDAQSFIEVVYCFQRLIDEDGAEGIYCTTFSPKFTGHGDVRGYAKFELLNGFEDYPFVVTPLRKDTKRLYDIQPLPEQMRGLQWQVKVERDSRVDRNGLATLPPRIARPGDPAYDYGPGRTIQANRPETVKFADVPPFNPGSIEIEQTMLKVADGIVGMDPGNPMSAVKQQWFVNKFLGHIEKVIGMAFKMFQRFGKDEVFFRVTGVPDVQKFTKGNPDEQFDIKIGFDVLNNDPETTEKKLEQFVRLVQFDRNGRINVDSLIEMAAASVDPVLADSILQPIEESQQKMVRDVTDDLTKIFSGIEVGARPQGASIAMQIIQGYAQQPDIAQRLQTDKAFAQRLQKYAEQYQMALMQMQNAETGKLGTAPATVGAVRTQGMQQ